MVDATVGPEVMKRVMGAFASGVVVVTAMDGGAPVGMACQSFASLSLEPPLVCFCPARTSTTWPRISRAGRFAVSVLASDQQELCAAMARSGADTGSGTGKFAGVDWRPGENGSPLLAGALAWIEADVDGELPGGDHSIVVGRVTRLAGGEGGDPLLFFRSRFGSLQPA